MKQSPDDICAAIKEHGRAIKESCDKLEEVLSAVRKERMVVAPTRFAFPDNVREAALGAVGAVSRFSFCVQMDLDVLHDALGLGEMKWSGPCKHSKQKD